MRSAESGPRHAGASMRNGDAAAQPGSFSALSRRCPAAVAMMHNRIIAASVRDRGWGRCSRGLCGRGSPPLTQIIHEGCDLVAWDPVILTRVWTKSAVGDPWPGGPTDSEPGDPPAGGGIASGVAAPACAGHTRRNSPTSGSRPWSRIWNHRTMNQERRYFVQPPNPERSERSLSMASIARDLAVFVTYGDPSLRSG